ncbi:MAG: dTDP-4-dehydrorhamnose reductase [Lentisphaeria bacterium]|nr:dTDP-4-dehydrorhamnose reductase [Lentisphaeria bacterium]
MQKILITGGKGMLGRTLQKQFADYELIIADLPEADICDAYALLDFFRHNAPDIVIHCAAMTQVDNCESDLEGAFRLNAAGSANVAAAAKAVGARLIAVSTDYVFRGDAAQPYTENDATEPQTVYGMSKLAGENAIREIYDNHVIARIAWLYGSGGPSFLHTMLKLADGSRPVLKVVNDQHGNPTSTNAVAKGLRNIIMHPELKGVFHLTCEGEATWYEFTREIFRQLNINQKVIPCATAEYPRPAPRPANSRLAKQRLREAGLPAMPDWRTALAEFLSDEFGTK